ncbi:MAG: flavin reductase family protein [Chthoniobacteraceae bacterium]|nr:flavin reductase family protein [Chthoniobacteraceae bacterium]
MKTSLGPKLLLYPTPVLVVGTYDADGKPNVMTASWGGICCSQPPCVNVSLRKATYSYHNLMARKAFTLSIPSVNFVRQADYFGLASGRDTDKFAASGLTAQRSDLVDAPYVAEFPLILECRLLQAIELGLHTMFVGEVADVKANPAILTPQGDVDMRKLQPLLFATGTKEYYGAGDFIAKAFTAGRESD